jgi:transcriptional antiterminator NusG
MKKWFIVQLYAGYEELVRADLLKRIQEYSLGDLFGQILIPSTKTKQVFSEEQSSEDQQLFPGYMVIEMDLNPESKRLVTATPRIIRFLGGNDPASLSNQEVDRIMAQMRGEMVIKNEQHEFEVGREVEIKTGPFVGFIGIIDAVDQESEKLTVMVSIFGRMTPVEIGFDQVKY